MTKGTVHICGTMNAVHCSINILHIVDIHMWRHVVFCSMQDVAASPVLVPTFVFRYRHLGVKLHTFVSGCDASLASGTRVYDEGRVGILAGVAGAALMVASSGGLVGGVAGLVWPVLLSMGIAAWTVRFLPRVRAWWARFRGRQEKVPLLVPVLISEEGWSLISVSTDSVVALYSQQCLNNTSAESSRRRTIRRAATGTRSGCASTPRRSGPGPDGTPGGERGNQAGTEAGNPRGRRSDRNRSGVVFQVPLGGAGTLRGTTGPWEWIQTLRRRISSRPFVAWRSDITRIA